MKGSLNSTNYLVPFGFLNKIKAFFKKRHTASIEEQYEIYGVRAFDFHIDFTKNNRAIFKYDGIPYDTFSIYSCLNYLNKKGNAKVRMVLEDDSFKAEKEARFNEYCSVIEKIYKDIEFFGGYREEDRKTLYKFKHIYVPIKIKWYDILR